MHTPMQWILYTAQQRRKHKQYEAARLDGMCVTLRPGTIIVKKETHCIHIFIGTCIIVIAENKRPTWCHLLFLFHFLCTQHVSDINISIIRSLQVEACNTDTTPTQPHRNSNTHRTKNNMTNVVIQQNSRKLLTMDILMSETCWVHKKWNKNSKWHKVGLLFQHYIQFYIKNSRRADVYGIWYFGSNSRKMKQDASHISLLVITTKLIEKKVAATDIWMYYKYNVHTTCRFWDYDYQIRSEVQERNVFTCLYVPFPRSH